MKKTPPVLSPPPSSNPAFWVDASSPGEKARSGPAGGTTSFDQSFAADAGWSPLRWRRAPSVRHYVIYDEPDLAAP
jgi:hypothetical protein